MKVLSIVLSLCLLVTGSSAQSASQTEIDDHLWILTTGDEQQRCDAAAWLATNASRLSENQARMLAAKLRDRDAGVRQAVAVAIGRIASQKHYHLGSKQTPPELVILVKALSNAFLYYDQTSVRVAMIWAVSEFDSSHAQIVLDRGKSDTDQYVREAAYVADRVRQDRLLRSGYPGGRCSHCGGMAPVAGSIP